MLRLLMIVKVTTLSYLFYLMNKLLKTVYRNGYDLQMIRLE